MKLPRIKPAQKQSVYNLLRDGRPRSREDIVYATGVNTNDVRDELIMLTRNNKITAERHGDTYCYEIRMEAAE